MRLRCRLHRLGRRRRGRRRFGECNVDQPLDQLARSVDVDVEAAKQCQTDDQLNENDRGERNRALPRPNCSSMFSVSGHELAPA
jgi:hypothetical protein